MERGCGLCPEVEIGTVPAFGKGRIGIPEPAAFGAAGTNGDRAWGPDGVPAAGGLLVPDLIMKLPIPVRKPDFKYYKEVGIPVSYIDQELCTVCGRCSEVCAFNALAVLKDRVIVLEELCHGCGNCAYFCPENAISEYERPVGYLKSGFAGELRVVHACLGITEENSGKLVTIVRNQGRQLAESTGKEYLLIDGPPGIGCAVIAALSGIDAALVVAEPTVSGIHGLE